jgi:hypothetical protein
MNPTTHDLCRQLKIYLSQTACRPAAHKGTDMRAVRLHQHQKHIFRLRLYMRHQQRDETTSYFLERKVLKIWGGTASPHILSLG